MLNHSLYNFLIKNLLLGSTILLTLPKPLHPLPIPRLQQGQFNRPNNIRHQPIKGQFLDNLFLSSGGSLEDWLGSGIGLLVG
jgi:hypothetical protein